jgi:hypothetical protein
MKQHDRRRAGPRKASPEPASLPPAANALDDQDAGRREALKLVTRAKECTLSHEGWTSPSPSPSDRPLVPIGSLTALDEAAFGC